VDRRAQVDDRRACAHLGVGDLARLGGALVCPAVAAGNDPRCAVARIEVDQRHDRRQLHLGVRLREQVPHQLVAVQVLRVGARTTHQQVRQVELVAGARRAEDRVARAQQQRVDHDLGGERPRLPREPADVLGAVAEEELDRRVQMAHRRIRGPDERIHLGVDRGDGARIEQVVDDHAAVVLQGAHDVIGGGGGGQMSQLGHGNPPFPGS